MNDQEIGEIAKLYNLGRLTAIPRQITGGKLHQRFWFKTPKGEFSIKQLSKGTDLAAIKQSENIALKFSQNNIPCCCSLKVNQQPMIDWQENLIQVFPWITGTAISVEQPFTNQAKIMSHLLDKIHQQDMHYRHPPAQQDFSHNINEWKILAEGSTPWSERLNDHLDDIERWNNNYSSSVNSLAQEQVISHRDLTQNNVIWSKPDSPIIIDWELSGMINPMFELIGFALNWACQNETIADEACFKTIIQTYFKSGSRLRTEPLHGFNACLGSWLNWLYFNCQRYNTTATTELNNEITHTILLLDNLSQHVETYLDWFNDCIQ